MAGFSVNIGADITPLTTGLNQATAEVKKFSATIESAAPTTALSTLNNVVSVTSHSFDELAASSAALSRVSDLIDKMAADALSAGNAVATIGDKAEGARFPDRKSVVEGKRGGLGG